MRLDLARRQVEVDHQCKADCGYREVRNGDPVDARGSVLWDLFGSCTEDSGCVLGGRFVLDDEDRFVVLVDRR